MSPPPSPSNPLRPPKPQTPPTLKSDLGIVSQKEFSDYNVEAQATIVQDYYSRFLRNGNNLLPANDINSYNNKFTQKDYEEKLKNHILK